MTATELLREAGVEERLLEPLAHYAQLAIDANRSFNITGAKTIEEFVPHVIDSLTVVPYVRQRYVDVGSGAGLPAIPVAIATGVRVTLIETTQKKARFLREMLEAFDLEGEVVAERAEVAGHDPRLREQFASGTARAVSGASTVAELLLPLLAVEGVAVMQRGMMDHAERTALEDSALVLGGAVEREIPLEGGRRIILVRKTGETPLRFPRRTGVPEKRPLCS
jgi:16S rRNA (guanine527-N7)-methyltransferase